MLKKLSLLLVVAVIATSVAACGGTKESSPADAPVVDSSVVASDGTEASAPEESLTPATSSEMEEVIVALDPRDPIESESSEEPSSEEPSSEEPSSEEPSSESSTPAV